MLPPFVINGHTLDALLIPVAHRATHGRLQLQARHLKKTACYLHVTLQAQLAPPPTTHCPAPEVVSMLNFGM